MLACNGVCTIVRTSTPSNKGLSTGAQIGIGVAVPLIVILFICLAILWYLRRRKASKAAFSENKDKPESKIGTPATQYHRNCHQDT